MAVAIANALEDGLDFHVTPDGQGRKIVKDVTVSAFPADPETHIETDEFLISPGELGLPYVETAEVKLPKNSPVTAEFDDTTASIRVTKGEAKVEVNPETGEETELPFPGAKFQVTAFGPPEFRQVDPTR